MYFNESYSKVQVDKNLLDEFPIQNGLEKGDAFLSLFFNFASDYAVQENEEDRSILTMSMFWVETLIP
jgi:hypothetical protein